MRKYSYKDNDILYLNGKIMEIEIKATGRHAKSSAHLNITHCVNFNAYIGPWPVFYVALCNLAASSTIGSCFSYNHYLA